MIKAIAKLFRPKARYHYKSAITGKFVTKAYFEAFPDVTYRVRVN
jgi:hypothetical protein